jgi:hypothetical protein
MKYKYIVSRKYRCLCKLSFCFSENSITSAWCEIFNNNVYHLFRNIQAVKFSRFFKNFLKGLFMWNRLVCNLTSCASISVDSLIPVITEFWASKTPNRINKFMISFILREADESFINLHIILLLVFLNVFLFYFFRIT